MQPIAIVLHSRDLCECQRLHDCQDSCTRVPCTANTRVGEAPGEKPEGMSPQRWASLFGTISSSFPSEPATQRLAHLQKVLHLFKAVPVTGHLSSGFYGLSTQELSKRIGNEESLQSNRRAERYPCEPHPVSAVSREKRLLVRVQREGCGPDVTQPAELQVVGS